MASIGTTHRRVRDVLAVPRQEVRNLVSGCNADVKRIHGGFPRECPAPHKFLGKSGGLVGNGQGWNSSKRLQPASTCAGIPESGLVPNDLRGEQPIGAPPLPPSPGQLLVSSDDDVATGARTQVADDARLDVYGGIPGAQERLRLRSGQGRQAAATGGHQRRVRSTHARHRPGGRHTSRPAAHRRLGDGRGGNLACASCRISAAGQRCGCSNATRIRAAREIVARVCVLTEVTSPAKQNRHSGETDGDGD